ncbi:hypothetical protein HJC23_009783 [Cyclotella cryptica]|uniref:Plastid lipid-associated protein/fibrillin conserved domain-containing protein n=1 Tax=Cyclotella cryptica TaxID=29204 RepID=A0ABD3PS78_9STRA
MIRNHQTCLGATSLISPRKIPDQTTQNTASRELLRLLQQKASVKPNTQSTDSSLDNQINSLVRTLIASKSTFDPTQCLNGPLYATIHFIGDTPLWEKIAVGGGRNVKGQRYTLSDETSGEFVNYAEIWGQNLYLKAVGKFNDKGSVSSSIGPYAESSNNPFEFLAPLVANLRGKEQLKPTPYDYEAIVTGASFVLFQKYSFDVAIAGKGVVRVLYADPNLRIFLSPTDTNVTTGGGDWESAGLIVVQVRFDLVYSDWNDRLLGV